MFGHGASLRNPETKLENNIFIWLSYLASLHLALELCVIHEGVFTRAHEWIEIDEDCSLKGVR